MTIRLDKDGRVLLTVPPAQGRNDVDDTSYFFAFDDPDPHDARLIAEAKQRHGSRWCVLVDENGKPIQRPDSDRPDGRMR